LCLLRESEIDLADGCIACHTDLICGMDLSAAVDAADSSGAHSIAPSAPGAESAASNGHVQTQQTAVVAEVIPLDVVLESEEFCADYVGLHPRGFGQGELITTPSTIRKVSRLV
jgi:hypothetical protein